MQDVRIRIERSNHTQSSSSSSSSPLPASAQTTSAINLEWHHSQQEQQHLQQRPANLFMKTNLNCDTSVHNNIQSRSPSSEEDNSPTEMNNCRRLIDKPPLVKRLTMGLLRLNEESRPLVTPSHHHHQHHQHNNLHQNNNSNSNNNSNNPNNNLPMLSLSPTTIQTNLLLGSTHTISDGYVNEGICDPDKLISSKFGDSCRKSLTSVVCADRVSDLTDSGNICGNEFDLKKTFLRGTSSANSSPKIFPLSAPMRLEGLSLGEQTELKGAAWFQAGIPREISLEVLSRQNPGAFLVRQSSTKPGCFALSLRVPPPAPKVAHYLILRTHRGYKIKGFTKEFTSLRALITHHSVMPELLPVPLALPRPQHIVPDSHRRNLDDFDTYGSLNDFRKIMSDLNV